MNTKMNNIVCISDLHGHIPEIPKCDVLCISGDIVPLKIQRNIEACKIWFKDTFKPFLEKTDCKHVVMTWGNHDFIGQKFYNENLSGETQSNLLFGENSKFHILVDESIIIDNIKFYGTPWIPELYGWAFYGASEFLRYKFNNIPEDTNILLTHCPPKFGTQGVVLQNCWNYMKNFGCQELYDVIKSKNFKELYVISGHIHSGCHDFEEENGIKYINVSLKDENYEITYEPKIIKL